MHNCNARRKHGRKWRRVIQTVIWQEGFVPEEVDHDALWARGSHKALMKQKQKKKKKETETKQHTTNGIKKLNQISLFFKPFQNIISPAAGYLERPLAVRVRDSHHGI